MKISPLCILAILITHSLAAQNYSPCQAPDAHMNPDCNGSTPALPSAAASLAGEYSVTGKTPEGAGYEGTVTISGDDSAGYTFSWSLGESQYAGQGRRTGDSISIDWGAPEPVVYKISRDGKTLKGKWGSRGKGREALRRK